MINLTFSPSSACVVQLRVCKWKGYKIQKVFPILLIFSEICALKQTKKKQKTAL